VFFPRHINQSTIEPKAAPPNKFVLIALAVFFLGAGALALTSYQSNAAFEAEQSRAQREPLLAVAADPDAQIFV
jgi:hypothetical protein